MKRVALICPLNYDFAVRYIDAALKHNLIPLVITTKSTHIDFSKYKNIEEIKIDELSSSPYELLNILRNINDLAGIVASGEFSVEATEFLCAELGLIRAINGDPSVLRNKKKMRNAFQKQEVSQPMLIGIFTSHKDLISKVNDTIHFPVISKPVDMAGSWYVSINHTPQELIKNAEPIFSYKKSFATGIDFKGECIIETFFEGKEYSAEVIVESGLIINYFINKKFVSELPNFDEIGHICGEKIKPEIAGVLERNIEKIIRSAEINSSILHVEFKINNKNEIAIIEVGCRVAGDYITRLVNLTYGVNLEEILIMLKCGIPLPNIENKNEKKYGIEFLFREKKNEITPENNKTIIEEIKYNGRTPAPHLSPTHLQNRIGYNLFYM
ncbi:ATP-grasp domain-containing protein [Dickeya dianthicola]|uniref:ATP-grasp domain-containing protein n=1 Tax=Dickeya dianthicola TaxID=204039 RepID=UPI00301AD0E9